MSLARQTERLTDAYLAAVLPLEEYQRRRLELEPALLNRHANWKSVSDDTMNWQVWYNQLRPFANRYSTEPPQK